MKDDKEQIRQIIDSWINSFYDKNADAAMSLHDPDLVSFDIASPLQYIGSENYKKLWDSTFIAFEGPIIQEIIELNITVGKEIAFSHSLNRMKGTFKEGQKIDFWYRWTACFKKINEKWLIVHDHTSAPTNFSDGTSVLNLKP